MVGAALACAILSTVAPAGAIVGGQPDEGRHPAAGALVGYFPRPNRYIAYCSGTLIAPRVFLTAAHCGFDEWELEVTFDEVFTPGSSVTYPGIFVRHPEFREGVRTPVNDVGVLLLEEPVSGIVPARLPTEHLLDELDLHQWSPFTSVGYGSTGFENGPGGKSTRFPQRRNYAVGTFDALTPQALHLSQRSATGDGGTCAGDSGGPNFIGAGDDETAVIGGITSQGDTYCEATNVTQRVDIPSVREFLGQYVSLP